MAKVKVKTVQVRHGALGNPNARRIEGAIRKWVSKGYRLDNQQVVKAGCLRAGYTLLTFVQE